MGKFRKTLENDVEKGRLSETEIARIRAAISKGLNESPPTIGVVGVSGTGKSSTLNVLFKTSLSTSPTVACTKQFWAIDLKTKLKKGPGEGLETELRVIDAPGLGEDQEHDTGYLALYEKHLPLCDIILWVLAARNRALALDQLYLAKLKDQHHKIVFGLNQVDLVEPLDWDDRINMPSRQQEHNIEQIVADRSRTLGKVFGGTIQMVAYSAATGYNLEELFHRLVNSAAESRQWIFASLKNFNHTDFVPQNLQYLLNGREHK